MTRENWPPSPDDVTVIGNAPRFFKRDWPGPLDRLVPDAVVLNPGVTIYGYAAMSWIAEDHPLERRRWEQRRAFGAWCFSVAEPDGEWGDHPADAVTEITREEFEAARARGWADA